MFRLEHQFNAFIGQRISPLVSFVAVVSFDPAPADCMARLRRIERLPEIDIFDWRTAGGLPAPRFPAMNPFANTFLYILTIGMNDNVARSLQGIQCFNFLRKDENLYFLILVF